MLGGNKEAWPVYMSIGNIRAKDRNTPSNGSWVLLAYIPLGEFSDPSARCQTLKNRLFHQCLKIVLAPLFSTGVHGEMMVTSTGLVLNCFPRLGLYLADYPEQLLINIAGGRNSPVTTASSWNLGDSDPSPPRTYDWIMERLLYLRREFDTVDIPAYSKAAAEYGLNGVDKPFWEDLPGYQPELCIAPDILHGLHRLWRDHILKWAQHLVGNDELNSRLAALQPVVGYRRYPNGISKMKQWTGRDDRELQRVLVAVISGAAKLTPRALTSFRAFHDFCYIAQYVSHNDTTLQYLEDAKNLFHSTKSVFITLGARLGEKSKKVLNHFNIPKIAAMHTYAPHIRQFGASPQYSTDITEYCHQPMAKDAYRSTNHKEYEVQMCRFLIRKEAIRNFREFLHWVSEDEANTARDAQRLKFLATLEGRSERYQQLAMEIYENECLSHSPELRVRGHIWLSRDPCKRGVPLSQLRDLYKLRDFIPALSDFMIYSEKFPNHLRNTRRFSREDIFLDIATADVWRNLYLQLPTAQDEDVLADWRTVQALPPDDAWPRGRCHCVLVHDNADARPTGIEGT